MRSAPLLTLGIAIAALCVVGFQRAGGSPGAPRPDTIPAPDPVPAYTYAEPVDEWAELAATPATGPVRVALQAGHWKALEAPPEQSGLRDNGTRIRGKAEWEVNLEIARRAVRLLEEEGFLVDLLPTTIPPGYRADLFISIHADAHPNPSVSGYRAAAPRRDATGRAQAFADALEESYASATGLPYHGNVTRRMRGYYAFNYRRYEHALHPATVGVILETGFLTSARDRRVIVGEPERAARGIAEAAARYLRSLPPRPAPKVVRPAPAAPPIRRGTR